MKNTRMNDEYEVIKEFECFGKSLVTVRIRSVAHVMSQEEWHKVYGRNHQDKWETKADWNRFKSREKYIQNKVS